MSGKGGVGKTMLSVAIASELAYHAPTLLIDLDFFNRGLTGLLAPLKCPTVALADPPSFLKPDNPVENDVDHQHSLAGAWPIVNVASNLFHISYGDLSDAEIRRFETLAVEDLKTSLQIFVLSAAEAAGCRFVVLDCHGGPDNSSFASCHISQHSLLVSEPDRITLFGTLNFLRQLSAVNTSLMPDIHLVFNKVVPAFSSIFLKRFYDRYIRPEFGGKPLLALYPLEVGLTKEFEKTPFLTSVYPYSLLARKTRVLVRDLLGLAPETKGAGVLSRLGAIGRFLTRWTLGKPVFVLDINFVMPLIVGCVIASAAIISAKEVVVGDLVDEMNRDFVRLLAVVALKEGLFSGDAEHELMTAARTGNRYSLPDEICAIMNDVGDLPYLRCRRFSRMSFVGNAQWVDYFEAQEVGVEYKEEFERSLAGLRVRSKVAYILAAMTELLEDYGGAMVLIGALWWCAAIVFAWSRDLDSTFVYFVQQRSYIIGIVSWVALLAVWFFPTVFAGVLVGDLGSLIRGLGSSRGEEVLAASMFLCLYVLIVGWYVGRSIWIVAVHALPRRRYVEVGLRLSWIGLLGVSAAVPIFLLGR